MESSVFDPGFNTPSKHSEILSNKEKAEITYIELQKRKAKKARNDISEFNNYKTEICTKARKRNQPYR